MKKDREKAIMKLRLSGVKIPTERQIARVILFAKI
jgi:hypothetical protein